MTQLFCVVLVCTLINWIIYLQEICIPEEEGFRVSVKQRVMYNTTTPSPEFMF